mgnify:CR=1 FL=1
MILSIEKASEECNDNKLKRKEFYLRNGFISSNKYIIDNGVKYEILITNKKYTSPQITSPLWTDIFYITSLLFFKYHFI